MSTSADLEARARTAFAGQFGGRADRPGLRPGPRRTAGQPHRLQRRAGHGRRHRPLHRGRPAGRCPGTSCACTPSTSPAPRTSASTNSNAARTATGPNYVKGVAWAIQEAAGPQLASGFDLAIAGNVPLGAGLSSSASLQAALALFLLQAGLVPGRSSPDYRVPT